MPGHTEATVYRSARADEVAWIAGMHIAAGREHVDRLVRENRAQQRLYRDKVQVLLELEPGGLLVAEVEGRVVGFIHVSRDYTVLRRRVMGPRRVALYALRAAAGRYGWDAASVRRALRRLRTFLGAGRRAASDVQGAGKERQKAKGKRQKAKVAVSLRDESWERHGGRSLLLPFAFLFGRGRGPERLGSVGHIIAMVVLEEWRRRGIATGMMDRAVAYLAAAGCAEVTLDVAVVNRAARATYERYGFRCAGGYRDMNCGWIVMRKRIVA